MEIYTLFLDWKNDHTTQGNLQIQCNPYHITNSNLRKMAEE